MPTLNQSTGELESGAAAKPSGLRTAVNKALTVLWILGATAVTGANGQQVAIATVPQQPGQGGPVTPGNGESTTEAPTAEEVIQILREGQGAIKKKFPSYNDAAFSRIVGEIGLGTVKPPTLISLAEAFTEEPEKRKLIIAFSKIANTPKPAPTLASPEDAGTKKLPPLNERPEEKKKRLEEERKIESMKKKLLQLNKWEFFEKNTWQETNSKGAHCEFKLTKNSITTKFVDKNTEGANPKSTALLKIILLPGKTYILTIGNVIGYNNLWLKMTNQNGVLQPAQKINIWENKIELPLGFSEEVVFEITNTALMPETKLEWLEIKFAD